MTKKLIICALIALRCSAGLKEIPDSVLIDEIKAIVDGPSSSDILTLTDIERRSFDGQAHKLEDLIHECAGKQHSEVLGVAVEDDDVLRYLRSTAQAQQQEASVTPEALKATAVQAGFETTDEFYDALKRLYGSNAAMEMEVRALAAVSEQEARAYADAHPLYKPSTYIIQTAFVPRDESMSKPTQKELLQKTAKTNKSLTWSTAFDVAEPDIAAEKQFIKTLKPNEIYVSETDNGFELYRLKHRTDQQNIPFDDRKKDVITKLREEKFNKAIAHYQQDLLDEVHVTTF